MKPDFDRGQDLVGDAFLYVLQRAVYPDDGSQSRCRENNNMAMMVNQNSGIEIPVSAMTWTPLSI